VLEKDIVLEFARLLAAKLSARLPVDTLLTRSDDSFVALTRRLPAPGSHATLFLSLHANACSDPELGGVELFYGGGQPRPASTGAAAANPQAVLLGRLLASALRAQIGDVRGPRAGEFRVLTSNPVPSALIEIGYLTHRGDAERAQDVAYREALTDALVTGVASFLRTTAPRL
jgi:N-acetylmuramoyl-L-alanine amidase